MRGALTWGSLIYPQITIAKTHADPQVLCTPRAKCAVAHEFRRAGARALREIRGCARVSQSEDPGTT